MVVAEIVQRNRIAALRGQAGMTVRELAERSGLSIATVSAAEIPQREPRRTTAAAIAKALGVPLDEVYS